MSGFSDVNNFKVEVRQLLKDKYRLKESQIHQLLGALAKGINQEILGKETVSSLHDDIEKLKSGVPLAYVVGYVDFLDCHIDLSEKTLIPRPETEYWVDKLIKELKSEYTNKKYRSLKALDLFCGSGCIGISLQKALPFSHITFADVSENALSQTEINLRLSKIDKSRYEIIQSDIFQNLDAEFDLILANPPYVGFNDEFGAEIKHEPQEALFAGKMGLDVIDKFLEQARNYLAEKGSIYMEFGETQKDKIEGILKRYEYSTWEFHKDQYGKWRYVRVQL